MRAVAIANKYGVDISHQQARQFSSTDFEEFDIIYAMDGSNFSDIVALAKSSEDIGKVRLILAELNVGNNNYVPDPYYGGDEGFEKVYQLLDAACEIITEKM